MAEHEARQSLTGTPKIVGRYRVTGRLGKGAMGVVYSAQDDQLGREVALKVMMADLQAEPETRARFYREAQVTSQLLHRNIITVFDFGQEDGRLYIVMELLKGTTLAEAVTGPEYQTVEDKVDLMLQMCDGLAAAHAKGIVHRDIKPGNLFVQTNGTLKILDFGVARIASSSMTASGLILGTPDYMSPEQACGKGVDGRSDIFSAAAVFYFMVTGRKPFEARELPVILEKVLRADPPPIGEDVAPGGLARIILKGLEKDPARRYQDFPELAADLVRFQRQFDVETRDLVASARERVALMGRLVEEVRSLSAGLELPATLDLASLDALRERYPFLDTRPGEGGSGPLRRRQVGAVLQDLEVALGPVVKAAERLRSGQAAVERGEQAIGAGDPSTALAQFDLASPTLGQSCARIDRGQVTARQRVAEARQRQEQCEALLADCRAAERAGDWTRAEQIALQALQIDPQAAAAAGLASRARAQIEAAAAARTNAVADLVQRAARATAADRLDEASRLLDEAQQVGGTSEAIVDARTRVAEARRVAAARDEERRAALRAIESARERFATDQEGAVREMERFAADHPSAAGAAAELERLRLEMAAHGRRAQAAGIAAEAEAACARGAYDEALRHAEGALHLDAANRTALEVRQRARAGLAALAAAADRAERARPHVERARQMLAARNPEKALREVHRALEIDPARADTAALFEEARGLQAAADTERKQAEAAARSARAGAHVERGRHLLRAGRLDKAEREFDRSLELEPRRADALAALEDLRRERAARSAPKPQAPAAPDSFAPRSAQAATGVRVAAVARLRKSVLVGAAVLLVLLAAFAALRLASGPRQPERSPSDVAAQRPSSAGEPAAVRTAQPAGPSEVAAPAGPGVTAPATTPPPTAQPPADAQNREAQPAGPQPTVRRRQGETATAWYARDREVARRYQAATTALDAQSFDSAVKTLTEVEQLAPGYRDVTKLLGQARDGLRAIARQAIEAGTRAEAASDWPAALQHYERAARADPSIADLAAESGRRVHERMKADGLAALRSARQYDALGRVNEAIAAYERALRYLPPDDPNAKDASDRLAALRKN